jgi:hypothetical protein
LPLRDHFQPPLRDDCPWDSFHSAWANALVVQLNQRLLPANYRAIPQVHLGTRVEVDVGTFHGRSDEPVAGNGVSTAVWAPPQAKYVVAVDFTDPDIFEVQVRDKAQHRLVAAVELISPANKDRPSHRRDFAIKCASYLRNQVAIILVDVVTERHDSLHGELIRLLQLPAALVEAIAVPLYAVAYRLRIGEDCPQLELWPEGLAVGNALPTLPLWLTEEIGVPLDLEASYRTTCEVLRIS